MTYSMNRQLVSVALFVGVERLNASFNLLIKISILYQSRMSLPRNVEAIVCST